VAADKIPLSQDRSRRSQIAVLAQIVVPVADPMADVVAVAAKVPVVVRPQRVVVMVLATVMRVPRIDAEAEIRVVVVVPEIVMVIAGSNEQVNQQRRRVDHDMGRVIVAGIHVNLVMKVDGREQQPAAGDAVIPVSVDIEATGGRPNVPRGNPNPVLASGTPIARPPAIVTRVEYPATGQPKMVIRRRLAIGSRVQALRRSRQIVQLFGGLARPETGNPLRTAFGFRPISGNPSLIRRNDSPDTANPIEILALIVPGPVAGNPLHIFTFRYVFRRDFLNRLGRPLRHDHSGRGIRIVLFGERLVDRTASEHLHVFTFTGVCRRRCDDLLGGDPLRRRRDDASQQAQDRGKHHGFDCSLHR
jgi:hypothetical protein